MERIKRLTVLLHHRWTLLVLVELYRLKGSKLVTLVHRLGISHSSLRITLRSLVEGGYVMRNPGYGHPMRPEYVLTPSGVRIAAASHRLVTVLCRLGLEDVTLRKWSLPVTLALRQSGGRFNEVKALLPKITPRALTTALKNLQGGGLVERHVVDGYPPQTQYRLTKRAELILPHLRRI